MNRLPAITDHPSVRDILIEGLADWVDLGFARQYVSDEVGDVGPVELREQTLGVLAALLDAGLVVVLPLLVQQLVDNGIGQEDVSVVVWVAVAMVAVAIAKLGIGESRKWKVDLDGVRVV